MVAASGRHTPQNAGICNNGEQLHSYIYKVHREGKKTARGGKTSLEIEAHQRWFHYYRVFLTFHPQMTALGKDGYVRTRKVLGTSFDVRFLKRSHTYGQIITGNI